MRNRVLHLDFETFSSSDLKVVGLENYVKSKDFAVTICAWAFDDEPVHTWLWPSTDTLPPEIVAHIESGGELRAWNATFESEVLWEHYKLRISRPQIVCTMQKAAAYGLPLGLLKAGQAMKAPKIKDETKRNLMLRMSRPRTNKRPYHEDPQEFTKLVELKNYCIDDVEAERALDKMIPELHPFEQQLSILDREINDWGVQIDTLMVARLMVASMREIQDIGLACKMLTGGAVTSPGTQAERLRLWLHANGLTMPNVNKEMVEKALAQVSEGAVKQVLRLRQMAAKSSTAKLQKMNSVKSVKDDRARYLLQFYGAGRTGRWAGRMIQPQNLPRVPDGFNPHQVSELAKEHIGLRLFFASPMDAISKCLRGCIIARPFHTLVGADLSQIEARVLAWIAAQDDVLETFRRGEDVYTAQAAKVGSTNRDLGKVLTLACGFGMGWVKFRETAAKAPYFVDLTDEQAKDYLYAWRRSNPMIVGYWDIVQQAVHMSVRVPGMVVGLTHGMAVRTENGVTQIRKPNGVKLTYHNMRVSNGGLVFDGVNSISKKWGTERTYGGRLVENIVQSVARDVMAEAMLRVRRRMHVAPSMTVHDEIVWEVIKKDGDLRPLFEIHVNEVPTWAAGLPVACKTFSGERYAK